MSYKSQTILGGKRARTRKEMEQDWRNPNHLFHKKRADSDEKFFSANQFSDQIFELEADIFQEIMTENEREIEVEDEKNDDDFMLWIENLGAEIS